MITIRRPCLDEIAALALLDKEVFGRHSYSVSSFRQFFDLAGNLLAIAISGGSIIGYSLILPAAAGSEGWFMALGVHEDHRRTGVGRALASAAIEQAKQSGLHALRLTAEPENLAAISLYKSLGFEDEELVREYFGPGEDRLVMCLN